MFVKIVLCTNKSRRIVFKTDRYKGSLYKSSPYYTGAKLWDSLSDHTIELPDIFTFKARLKRMNRVYVDLSG